MGRLRHLLKFACLALLTWQAAAQSLVYSVSYGETQGSLAARFGSNLLQRPVGERLAMLRRYRKTEIYKVSVTDGARVLLFSDEGKNFEIWPSPLAGQALISATKACVRGIEREWRTAPNPGAYSTPDSIYEISLGGSNSFRRLFETKPDLTAAIVNSAGTEALFESMENGRYLVYVYDTATWKPVRSWDLTRLLQAQCPDCISVSQGWLLQENEMFFNLDLGDEDSISPGVKNVSGTYIAAEDGSNFRVLPPGTGKWQMPEYKHDPNLPHPMIGQLPDGSYVFLDYAWKLPQMGGANPQPFLVITSLGSPAQKVIPLRASMLEGFHLSPSGRYLAYTEQRTTKDYKSERYLWVRDLQSGDEKELLFEPPPNPPSSPEPNQTFVVLGWLPEK